ncbi:MAG: hypothetical protein CME65_12045 [Halobacteriovoraceae bacterium]|nr:hypothetical protein [Halobacteriovoraceae bacterium]
MKVFSLVILLASFPIFAQDERVSVNDARTAVGNLSGNNWRSAHRTDGGPGSTGTGGPTEVFVGSQGREVRQACAAAEQTSLPYNFLRSILVDGELTIDTDSSNGSMEVRTGPMIANCNSMLERIDIQQPSNGRPYLVKFGIHRPAGCTGEVCPYTVQQGEDGVFTGETLEINVEPSYFGFIQCLKETGALDESMNVDPSKIVVGEMQPGIESGMTQTAQVEYYSRGPITDAVFASTTNDYDLPGSCHHTEKITETGLRFLSSEDARRSRKRELFNTICSSGDWKLIDSRLPDFEEFAVMRNVLTELRNRLILDEVKELHQQLNNTDDYSNLDAERYQEIIGAFYRKVIVPKRQEIERLVAEIQRTSAGSERVALLEQLEDLTEELVRYARAPYLTIGDYDKMKDFDNKGPLENEAWIEAMVSLFSANKTAYWFSSFNEEMREDNDLDIMSISEANRSITDDVEDEREDLDRISDLASDRDYRVSTTYRDTADDVRVVRDDYRADGEAFVQDELNYLYNHCYNPSKYWINRQRCAQRVMENIQANQEVDQQVLSQFDAEIRTLQEQAGVWEGIEARRDRAYGIARDGSSRTQSGRVGSADGPNGQVDYSQAFQQFMARMQGMPQQQGQQQFPQGYYNPGAVPQRGFGPQGYNQFQRMPAMQMPGYYQSAGWPQSSQGFQFQTQGFQGQRGMMYPGGNPNFNMHTGSSFQNPAYQYHMQSATQYGPMSFRQPFGY